MFFHLPYPAYIYRQNLEGIVSTRYIELRKINMETYSQYSIKAGIHECNNPSFKVFFLNQEKKILDQKSCNEVFFNTFLPDDIASLFYIDHSEY